MLPMNRSAMSLRSLVRSLAFGALLAAAGCATHQASLYHVVTTDSHYICCRTLRFTTAEFTGLRGSSLPGEGVVVKLGADTVRSGCGHDAEVPLTVANNGSADVYIPISNELIGGGRLKLYPWRLVEAEGRRVRLARQIQYGDLVEGTDAKLRFFRLPAGKEISFDGVIPASWLCRAPLSPYAGYLTAELDPKVYADYTRLLRDNAGRPDTSGAGTWGLRYDVIYTSLDFLDALPASERRLSAAGDTLTLHLSVPEEPATFVNGGQKVASSNLITLEASR